MPARRILSLVAAAALAAPACGAEEPPRSVDAPQAPRTIEIDGEEARDHGAYGVTSFEQVALIANDFYFEPTLITGPPGLAIEINVTSNVATRHTFTLPEQRIDEEIAGSGSGAAFGVTIPETGTVKFFCRYHRGQGMLGGLTAT